MLSEFIRKMENPGREFRGAPFWAWNSKLEPEELRTQIRTIDVLKVGHHGSAASVDEEMLAALTPELAVASAGEGNAYGHPSREARQLLAQAGCPFICTIEAGDVTLFPDDEGARVATARPCPIDARSGYNGSATST